MRFVDEACITIISGKGGSGCVSFRRERFIPKGGPDGGDGGRGGDVIFIASCKKRTLYHLRFNNQFRAGNGANGQGSKKHGKSGKDLIIIVPVGTVVIDSKNDCILSDLLKEGDIYLVAKGGIGGRGNSKFKSSTNRTPRFAQEGKPGIILSLRLELKLLANVGIIGLPNAGKSTLLGSISSARPKVGSYPFTTLIPNLGIVDVDGSDSFVVADIPGLIEGASKGFGLGIRFLKHVERTNILIHLVDVSQIDSNDPFKSVRVVNRELALYSKELSKKPSLFVINKVDLPSCNEAIIDFQRKCHLKGVNFLSISAISGKGVHNLILKLSEMLSGFFKHSLKK